MIYTFGDSHSMFGWRGVEGVKFNWLGPKLMYSFGNDPNIVDLSFVSEKDTVIFCFGEIDARCHIHKHIFENNTYESIIDNLVKNYFKSIKYLTDSKNIDVWVYNIVPARRFSNGPDNPDFPYLGTDEERLNYTLYFNKKIKEECEKYNYIFFDVYNKYSDNDGFLNPVYADKEFGGGHIDDPIYLIELKNLIFEQYKNIINIHSFTD